MKFLAGLLVFLAVVSQVEADCSVPMDCMGCVAATNAASVGCVWNVDEGSCSGTSTGLSATSVLATDNAQCARVACKGKADCTTCLATQWDPTDATAICKFDLESGACQKGFGSDEVTSSDIVITNTANCGLKSCASQTDCETCTGNNLKRDGETDDNYCIWKPKGDGVCEVKGKTDVSITGGFIENGGNCAADDEPCESYQDCEKCVIDVGTSGCEWDVNASTCSTQNPVASSGAKTVAECSYKEQPCTDYDACEGCVTDLGTNGCEWDLEEGSCSNKKPVSTGAKTVEECSAKNQACGDYTDCEGCVTDLGLNGCQWDVEELKCETKVPFSSAAKTVEECNSSTTLAAGVALVGAVAALLL